MTTEHTVNGLTPAELDKRIDKAVTARSIELDIHITKAVDRELIRRAVHDRVDGQQRSGTPLADRLLTRSALDQLPQLDPLIEDTLELGTIGLLAGPYGSCKSFVAQSWIASVATGVAWHGREVAQPGTVIYVAGEGASGIAGRLSAWEQATDTVIPDDRLITLPAPVNLSRAGEVAEFIAAIEDHRPILVVFETLNRCAVGADENSATEMGKVIDAMYQVRAATADGRGTVLVVHHAGKDGTIRGSSSLGAAMDTVYETQGNAALVTLKRTKRKDGEAADELTLSLRTLGQSGVLDLVHPPDRLVSAQDHLLSAFMSAFSDTGATKADLRKIAAQPPASFHRTVNALVNKGALVNIASESRPFYRLGGL